ncbi:hypothetical protein D0Z00_000070 [Geotrichum galactomycetum]|uniref:Uncharacterized protein n=1 Tax=Geotrichum galactomycetum TaxID=27317 RepID=A0ACB6VAT6_9ASCO|nr:hypothetical protein D0Z00_000070 [Geotrichum candidum]
MGSAASKQARKLPVKPFVQAAGTEQAPLATRTKYEKFTPAGASDPAAPPQPHTTKNDGMDPDTLFNDRLRELGQFNIPEQIQSQLHALQRQQQSQYQKSNPLLSALASRATVAAQTQQNLDASDDGTTTRQYLHPQTITAILTARDADGDSPARIKAEFNIDDAVLARLGPWLRRPSAPPVLTPKTVVADVGRETREAHRALRVDTDMSGEDPR